MDNFWKNELYRSFVQQKLASAAKFAWETHSDNQSKVCEKHKWTENEVFRRKKFWIHFFFDLLINDKRHLLIYLQENLWVSYTSSKFLILNIHIHESLSNMSHVISFWSLHVICNIFMSCHMYRLCHIWAKFSTGIKLLKWFGW